MRISLIDERVGVQDRVVGGALSNESSLVAHGGCCDNRIFAASLAVSLGVPHSRFSRSMEGVGRKTMVIA